MPKMSEATILHKGLEKKMRKTVEAAYIVTENVTNHRDGFVNLARPAGKLILLATGEVKPGG